jgi:hypothetical protein
MGRLLMLVGLALALALAGCGVAPSPEQALSDSTGTTAEAGSSRIAVSYDGEPFLTGTFDYQRGAGLVDGPGGLPATIITEDAVYNEISGYGKRHWLELPVDSGPELLEPFANSTKELFGFLSAAGEVERIGSGVERGEEVTRYRARVNVERALLEVPQRERAKLRALFDMYWPGSERTGIPVRLALDAEGRIRRVDLTVLDLEHVIELYDYGVKVDAKPPPANEVISYDEIQELEQERMAQCEKRLKQGEDETSEEFQRDCGRCHAGEEEEADVA